MNENRAEEKRAIDGFGATALIGFAVVLAVNQVVIKVTGGGFGPVFQAGLRSVLGLVVLLIWIRVRRISIALPKGVLIWGLGAGILFSFEFVCLYIALDLTTVSRASIIFYSMPVWLAMAGHFWLPGERLSGIRVLGLTLAMCGVVLALTDRSGGQASLMGDLMALLAALQWAGIALFIRITPLRRVVPEMQLLVQVAVSIPVLLGLSPLFGDLLRDPGPLHLAGLVFQSVFVISLGYLVWMQLMSIYRASSVASFSFLSPVFAVFLGWLVLDETIGPAIWGALVLVAAGVFLINRR
ncbi:MAG: drug/metabolite transporter (DMT)-like permease [Paracoccaceae bacterium]|jgi:drug/metabolite transporter (DMT)-like permease